MDDRERDELRRLALWLSRRRAVDEAVASLTAYGPAASDQVSTHLDALKQLLAAEQEAFAAVEAASPRRPQSPLPQSHRPQSPQPLPSQLPSPESALQSEDESSYPDSYPGQGSGAGATVHSLGQARARQHR